MSKAYSGAEWFDLFQRCYPADPAKPNPYTLEVCQREAALGTKARTLADRQGALILAHNYLDPPFHEISDRVGDSLDLSMFVKTSGAKLVYFQSVYFMAATAKIICGDTARIFTPDTPQTLGCSLVFGTDFEYLVDWKRRNPTGILVTYINSDALTKSISDYIATSRNCDAIIVHAHRANPNSQILVLPDRYLGYVMKRKAVDQGVPADRIEVYERFKEPFHACCHVHELMQPSDAIDIAFAEIADDPNVGILIHPECGCASSCQLRIQRDNIDDTRAYIASTNLMIQHARTSKARKFYVATETGMIYRLRKELPEKQFLPISYAATCRFMKGCTLPKLVHSLETQTREIILCDDCCDPKQPHMDDKVVHIQRAIAAKAKIGIDRMLQIT